MIHNSFELFFVFRRKRTKRKRKVFPLSVRVLSFRQGLPQAMYFTLDGKGVFVYAPPDERQKGLFSISSLLNSFISANNAEKKAFVSQSDKGAIYKSFPAI